MSFNLLIVISLTYVAFLFAVAWWADKRAREGRGGWLRAPIIYTLSLSIYCTAWTFYGAVGYAARSGLEFVTIYLGPTIVMAGWWWVLRKLVRIGKAQRITSVADLISSRYGKSNLLGVIVTLMAVIGTTPYIALQLQSVVLSLGVFSGEDEGAGTTAFWIAIGLALFTVLFGTRNLDVNERHHGVVTAIAVEAIVKLVALLAVGVFVVWGVAGGPVEIARSIDASPIASWQMNGGRWATMIFLSAAAFLTLPRMFQVLVVENVDENQLATASWAFPLYMLLMSLFVIPIAVVGLSVLPEGANPDLFVLTVPLFYDQAGLATLTFLGGFSSATSMVIVAAIALSTMVSNHIVMPLWLSTRKTGASMSGDVRNVVMIARRASIAGVLALGYLYYHFSGGGAALAAIGLISFAGVAQVIPAMIGGLFWRGATRIGAAAGLIVGFSIWAYALFLPSFGADVMSPSLMNNGPFGLDWLRPQAFFGITGMDPVVHAMFWSMVLNALVFVGASLLSFPTPLERLQGAQFVNVFEHSSTAQGWVRSGVETEDLLIMAQRIMGARQAQALFQTEAAHQGKEGFLPEPTPEFLRLLERELSGSVGAATAHAMVAQIVGGASVSVEDLMAVADEAQQILEYSSQLEAKSEELTRTARQLSAANDKLTQLSIQKDAFLSQISHELRTPMTSIRSFSEILRSGDMSAAETAKYSGIIQDETIRLTRLLDDLLDLSVLEAGRVSLNFQTDNLAHILDRAVASGALGLDGKTLEVQRDRAREDIDIETDTDRLAQVFINLIANARKYCAADQPLLTIKSRREKGMLVVDFIDNGPGIPEESQGVIFEKFSRLSDQQRAGGAGLGLAICREIMDKLGGAVAYLPGQGGAAFRVSLPL
ncbi:MAG: ATP-binding protein [Maritimibacter sp.]